MALGQWYNAAAVSMVTKVFWNPSLIVPSTTVRTIADIDWRELQLNSKTQYILFDKDNTLTAPYVDTLHPKVVASFKECLKVYQKNNVAIFSNSAGTKDDVDFKWKKQIEEEIGIQVIIHDEKKPKGFQSVVDHFTHNIVSKSKLCKKLLTYSHIRQSAQTKSENL
mmetsp:Transcript_690/g.724  ORF Transcript_690/g.724 Transcript_690/m.724 type:complete len:166 (+) Transcript_690:104-601(+)